MSVSGRQNEQYRNTRFADGTVFDARTASWTGLDDRGGPIPWVVTLRQADGTGRNSCWVGGVLRGPWNDTDSDVSWEDPYHHAGGLTIDVAELTVEGVRIENQGDGVHIVEGGRNATLNAVYMTDIHDDCVENDSLHAITITDSLFDGCYVAFSARPNRGEVLPSGASKTWRIERSLIRLEPQPTVYRGPTPGHGPFFKWDDQGRAPRLALHGNIFRVDQDVNHGTLDLPEDVALASCSDNVVVWLGSGPFPGDLPSCFRITTDRRVWDDAVAAWHRRH